MKKIMKSRIFLILICGIIFTGLGVCATITYKATDIVYNASDGTSMNVSDALNELYNKKGTSKITKIADIGTISVKPNSKPSYTYDIKNFTSNYSILTNENFFINVGEVYGNCSDGWGDTYVGVSKSYNASTGILTISSSFSTSSYGYQGSIFGVVVYMVE